MQGLDESKEKQALDVYLGCGAKKMKNKMRNRRSTYLRVEEGMSMWGDSSVMNDKKVGERK